MHSHFGGPEIANAYEPDQIGAGSDDVQFNVLGPLEMLVGGVDHTPKTPKILQLLALLTLRPGRVVHTDTIVRELWDSAPPRTVRQTLHTYVYHLRRHMECKGMGAGTEPLVATRSPGFVLNIAPTQVDVHRFHEKCRHGQDLLVRHQFTEAAREFEVALDMWSDVPLANVNCGSVLAAYTASLHEQRRTARRLRIEAQISDGTVNDLVAELTSLTVENPLDEGLHGQLMRVLGRTGRRSDAMASFHGLRGRLSRELGIEPCEQLRHIYQDLLVEGEAR